MSQSRPVSPHVRLANIGLLIVGMLYFSISTQASASHHVNAIRLEGDIINPVTADYITQAIERSENDRAECLIIQLDTPGGLLESTRHIVKAILNAKVPVIVYVAPSGSRAGSAGVFITLASHVAVMAPSTNIGAAHPVTMGKDDSVDWKRFWRRADDAVDENVETENTAESTPDGDNPVVNEPISDDSKVGEPAEAPIPTTPMEDKVLNDTVAWVEGIATARGRNVEWARQSVIASVSVAETEAVELGVVDLVATDVPSLLAAIDGRVIILPEGERTLSTADASIHWIEMSTRQRILNTIIHPNIAYILMLLGFYGLLFEVTHPGIGAPGIIGAICLILAFYAFHALPVNFAGATLIALGIVLFIAETQVVSFGLLTLGGIVAMTLGSLMLIDSPHDFMRISWAVILPAVGATAAISVLLVGAVVRSHRQAAYSGREGMIGKIGIADQGFTGTGIIKIHGELWNACSTQPINAGDRVTVTAVEGLTLFVEPADNRVNPL